MCHQLYMIVINHLFILKVLMQTNDSMKCFHQRCISSFYLIKTVIFSPRQRRQEFDCY
ncbi:hypothetical protein HanXRQr2_Chr05g0199501 [Helianthus annuus]|uniref:Uncharacterized protein n=1 Tax=Helianthus annuus TaxID=4232 RepID=A0A251UMN6_HELAN|nr:hypothetical protein HanXRQr2_Chr05g0199501 [Helianthus annuus]